MNEIETIRERNRKKIQTVKTHPMVEIIAKKLFGIECAPAQEQRKMVSRAVKAAAKEWDKLQEENEQLKKLADDLYFAYQNKDPECLHDYEIKALKAYKEFKRLKGGE